jgi:hypothetical protein
MLAQSLHLQLHLQSDGQEEVRPVHDIGSLVTEVFTAANNAENVNNDASDGAEVPNREFTKEELPEIDDEIENVNKEAEMETETSVNVTENGEDTENEGGHDRNSNGTEN